MWIFYISKSFNGNDIFTRCKFYGIGARSYRFAFDMQGTCPTGSLSAAEFSALESENIPNDPKQRGIAIFYRYSSGAIVQ